MSRGVRVGGRYGRPRSAEKNSRHPEILYKQRKKIRLSNISRWRLSSYALHDVAPIWLKCRDRVAGVTQQWYSAGFQQASCYWVLAHVVCVNLVWHRMEVSTSTPARAFSVGPLQAGARLRAAGTALRAVEVLQVQARVLVVTHPKYCTGCGLVDNFVVVS